MVELQRSQWFDASVSACETETGCTASESAAGVSWSAASESAAGGVGGQQVSLLRLRVRVQQVRLQRVRVRVTDAMMNAIVSWRTKGQTPWNRESCWQ